MSMNAKYRTLSARLAQKLREEPELAASVVQSRVDSDHQSRLESMMNALPPEMRERFAAHLNDPATRALRDQAAAALANLSAPAAATLRAAGVDDSEIGPVVDIEKAWHGLHYLLAKTTLEPTAPPGNAVLGGDPIGDDLGYGPPRLMDPEEVKRVADALAPLTGEEVRARFDAAAMNRAEIYGGHWDDPSEVEWLIGAFDKVKAFFVDAARAGHAALLYVS